MWPSRTGPSYPTSGDGPRGNREKSMMSQAEMILKKKREIEAKMANEERKKESSSSGPRRPQINTSVSKRWGLKGKKDRNDSKDSYKSDSSRSSGSSRDYSRDRRDYSSRDSRDQSRHRSQQSKQQNNDKQQQQELYQQQQQYIQQHPGESAQLLHGGPQGSVAGHGGAPPPPAHPPPPAQVMLMHQGMPMSAAQPTIPQTNIMTQPGMPQQMSMHPSFDGGQQLGLPHCFPPNSSVAITHAPGPPPVQQFSNHMVAMSVANSDTLTQLPPPPAPGFMSNPQMMPPPNNQQQFVSMEGPPLQHTAPLPIPIGQDGQPLASSLAPPTMLPPPTIMTSVGPPGHFPGMPPQHVFVSQSQEMLTQEQLLQQPPIMTTSIGQSNVMNMPPPPPQASLPPQFGSRGPPAVQSSLYPPPPVVTQDQFKASVSNSGSSAAPSQPESEQDKKNPLWWKDALTKAKSIASTLSKDVPESEGLAKKESPSNVGPRQQGDNDNRSEYTRALDRDLAKQNKPQNQRNRDNRQRDFRGGGASNGKNIGGGSDNRYRSRSRERSDRDRSLGNGSNDNNRSRGQDKKHFNRRDDHSQQGGSSSSKYTGGGRDRAQNQHNSASEGTSEHRDIDMRKTKNDSYSPTRPDYKPTIKAKAQLYEGPTVDTSEPLPTVIEELANMVAVSGEELEDIARERNKNAPELRFLFERTGTIYKRYRARITQIKESLVVKSEQREEPGDINRKSRWGGGNQPDQSVMHNQIPISSHAPVNVPPPNMMGGPGLMVNPAVGPPTIVTMPNLGPPGIANPTHLGPPGVVAPTHLGPPGIAAPTHLGPPGVVQQYQVAPPGMGPPGMLGPPGIVTPTHLGPPGVATPTHLGPPGIVAPTHLGPPGVIAPTHLGPPGVASHNDMGQPGIGGTPTYLRPPAPNVSTSTHMAPSSSVADTSQQIPLSSRDPGLVSYANKVFGTTDLSEAQWKQCEDQLKMSVMYGQMAAKQAAARIMAQAGKQKKQYEYDSDEDTEGGTWEHKQRRMEMEKTAVEASKTTGMMEQGSHHIGDFLPPEELNKFMSKFKAMHQPDNSEYQDNKLTQNNVGFKMLQKMGWSEGAGLGQGGSGITAPIGKSGNVGGAGLGANPSQADADDDEFDSYRKRMMLAYKFRPNPLNNPRRQYY